MSELDHQRVLMGIDQWDRHSSRHIDEAEAHKTRTAGYIADAMGALQRAKRASGHRKLKKGNKALHTALSRAHEACKRAHEMCYQHGETYEIEESLDEAGMADLDKPAQDLVNLSRDLYRLVGQIEAAARRAKRTHPRLSAEVLHQLASLDQKARRLSMDIDDSLGMG